MSTINRALVRMSLRAIARSLRVNRRTMLRALRYRHYSIGVIAIRRRRRSNLNRKRRQIG